MRDRLPYPLDIGFDALISSPGFCLSFGSKSRLNTLDVFKAAHLDGVAAGTMADDAIEAFCHAPDMGMLGAKCNRLRPRSFQGVTGSVEPAGYGGR